MAMIGARPTPSLGGAVPTSIGVAPALLPADGGFPQLPQLTAPKPKINWLGVLADALSGAAGQPGMYAARLNQDRQEQSAFERGEEMYQRRRQDQQTDADNAYQHQIQLFDYKRLHPDDALTQAMDAAGISDPAERQKYYRANVDRITAPPMMSAPGVDEQGNPVMRFFPRAPAAQSNSPPSAAVSYLKAHPEMKQQFEEKYGVGSASQHLGGPTQPASGNFR
jgi:hypothetical protein